MKSVWKGTISFGLVTIPVKLYTAIESQAISFRMLHASCKTPINYKKWCSKHKREVELKEIVKGLEVRKGQYIIMTKEDLEKIKPQKSSELAVVEFINEDALDPIYFDRHYYVVPEKEKDRAYFLFREVLQSTSKVAVGRFVMREKEYTCAIKCYKRGLLLSTLNYVYEVRNIERIPELQEKPKLKAEELDLAKKIIDHLYEAEFHMEKFKDTFADKLREAMDSPKKGRVVAEKPQARTTDKSLMAALKASVK